MGHCWLQRGRADSGGQDMTLGDTHRMTPEDVGLHFPPLACKLQP